ncbi:MAG: hypothetical protein L0Y58_02845 [Verrucomicrobia subdivision 3 bacterium]|nr:hypothetical protein [Limisphaerales bacterium]
MKILLQHSGSRLFYKSVDAWVEDETEARIFGSALEAIEFCERNSLSGLEIVLRPPPPGPDLRMEPIPAPPAPRPSPPA